MAGVNHGCRSNAVCILQPMSWGPTAYVKPRATARLDSDYDGLVDKAERLPSTKVVRTISSSPVNAHTSKETEAYIEKLRSEVGWRSRRAQCSSLKICLVAEGAADVCHVLHHHGVGHGRRPSHRPGGEAGAPVRNGSRLWCTIKKTC